MSSSCRKRSEMIFRTDLRAKRNNRYSVPLALRKSDWHGSNLQTLHIAKTSLTQSVSCARLVLPAGLGSSV